MGPGRWFRSEVGLGVPDALLRSRVVFVLAVLLHGIFRSNSEMRNEKIRRVLTVATARVASASHDGSVRLWARSRLCLLGELHMLRRREEILRRSGRVLQLDVQITDHASWWIATICSKADLPMSVTELIELAIIEPAAEEGEA